MYFAAAVECIETTPLLVQAAESEASLCGLTAADSLHVAAAKANGVQQFFTAEKSTSALFRVTGLPIISLRP